MIRTNSHQRRQGIHALLSLAAACALLVFLPGCFSIGGSLGPSLSLDARQSLLDQAAKAAVDGHGYVRQTTTTELGIGTAPERSSTSSTTTRNEDGWAPTPTPSGHSTKGNQ